MTAQRKKYSQSCSIVCLVLVRACVDAATELQQSCNRAAAACVDAETELQQSCNSLRRCRNRAATCVVSVRACVDAASIFFSFFFVFLLFAGDLSGSCRMRHGRMMQEGEGRLGEE